MDQSLESRIGGRKRKIDRRDSVTDLFPDLAAKAARRPPIDLGEVLQPTRIPYAKYRKIQSILNEQDEMILERGAEIKDRCTQIHNLKSELSEARADIEVYRQRIEQKHKRVTDLEKQLKEVKTKRDEGSVTAHEFQEHKQYYENFIGDQNQLINLGTKVLADKTAQVTRLENDTRKLEATVSSLSAEIVRLSLAPADELAEAQAQRTLTMVKGLQNDIAEREVQIENYRSENGSLTIDNNTYKMQNDNLNKAIAAHKNALQFANKQTAEAKAITEDQAKLIQRLMEENARLSANQRP